MDKPEAPRNHDNTTEEGIRHSGEPLSNEFKKTPLKSFEAIHLDNVPQSPSTLLELMPPVITTDEALTEPISVAPETEKSTEKKRRKLTPKQMVGAAAAGGSIIIASVFGAKAIVDNADNAPIKTPDDTTQVEEGNGKPPVVEEGPQQPVNEMEQLLNQEKPARFDELEAMTLDEFKLQPITDRVNYYGYLNRDAKHLAELWYEESDNPRDLTAVNMTVNSDNTGDEIQANIQSGLRGAMSRHFEEYDLGEVPNYTPEQREKMIASLYLNPGHPIALKWQTAVADETVSGYVPGVYVKNGLLLADDEVLSRTETSTYTDQNSIEHPSTELTVRAEDGQVATATHVLIQTDSVSQWVVAG